MAACSVFVATWLMVMLSLSAEDWTTTDGKVYQKVTVVKAEPDAVTILYCDGGALVPLAKLPPDLQKRFNYNPVLAQAAGKARVQSDAKSAQALQSERAETQKREAIEKLEEKAEQAEAKAALAASASYQINLLHPEQFGLDSNQNDPTHHKMQDALAPGGLNDR